MPAEIEINSMSLAQLVGAINAVGATVPDYKPVKTVPSKAKGIERIEAMIADVPAVFTVGDDGVVAVAFPDNIEGGEDEDGDGEEHPEEGGGQTEEEPVEETAPAAPFVKATKEELAAMDAATRADYRKRRRAAARTARKAKG